TLSSYASVYCDCGLSRRLTDALVNGYILLAYKNLVVGESGQKLEEPSVLPAASTSCKITTQRTKQ
ncbi:hypothetical protein BaRGS_00003292, partial [Batillaria attramentaria]